MKCVSEMKMIKSEWNGDLEVGEMEKLAERMKSQLKVFKDSLRTAKLEGTQAEGGQGRNKKLKDVERKGNHYKKFLRKMQDKITKKQISMGDRRGFDAQEDRNEEDIIDATSNVNEASKEAEKGYEEILKQKQTIMGFSSHIGNINTSIALSERYLRMMRDRDKRHRCIVTLMIIGMIAVIGCGGAIIFGT